MKKRTGPGRPAKPKSEKQSEQFSLYLTIPDAKAFSADVKKLGLSPSAFLADLWREWRKTQEN